MDFDFIDTDIFYEPAYWIIVGLALIGLFIGFGMSGFMSGTTGAQFEISLPIKIIIFIFIFPIAYVVIKIMNR